MRTKFGLMLGIIVFVAVSIVTAVPTWAGDSVFVAGGNFYGDAIYMLSNGYGSFSSTEILQTTQNSGITAYPLTYGNAIGDFNNDTHYDYMVALGYDTGQVYISAGDGTQFAPPVSVASWTEGYYPMDMAVGDFNGDGNLDFVMSYMFSSTTGLYLGNGNFGFTYTALPGSAPTYSAGIDAADFNGDGFIDFVVAATSYEPIYVNLNKGDGTFTPSTLNTHDGNGVYGIAAGDFDHDGIVDIATANTDCLSIYKGRGDGTFQWTATYDFDMNESPIDNYDFDNDGFEDLVAANYGTAINGMAVLLNNGDGSFYLDAVYPGAVGELLAVSAPPFVPNIEPVAVLDSNIMEATAGEACTLNGSQSYDEDGEIVSYAWDFGDGNSIAGGAAAQQTYTYKEAGSYVVTLTVTDDRGGTASVQAEVHVAAAPSVSVPVNVFFNPYLINLHSRDKWITAVIRVPRGYDARQIDAASVQILVDGGAVIAAQPDRKCGFFHKLFGKYIGRHTLSVKFDQKAVGSALAGLSGNAKLKVAGKIKSNGNAVDFSGESAVKVLPENKKDGWFAKLLKRCGWK